MSGRRKVIPVKKNTRGGSILIFISQQTQSSRQAGSGSAVISSCDTDYKIALAAPTYSVAANDYVISSATATNLDSSCNGETVFITVLREDGSVVTDGSSTINGSTVVNFNEPIPVAQSYVLKSALYGRTSS